MPPISIENPDRPRKEENFALEFNAVAYEETEGKFKPVYPPRYQSLNYMGLSSLLTSKHNEQRKAVEQLYDVFVSSPFVPERGVLVGTGDTSPHNVGFRLSHPHGFPYLPGSGIQGMVRSYFIEFVFMKQEHLALKDEGFYRIFGGERKVYDANGNETTEYRKGCVDFLDAFPRTLAENSVKKEVITNHYQDYYMEVKATQPNDSLNPIPIVYLATAAIPFQMYAGVRQGVQNTNILGGAFAGFPPLAVVSRYMTLAFKHNGVGARTKNNLGRGAFAPTTFFIKDRP